MRRPVPTFRVAGLALGLLLGSLSAGVWAQCTGPAASAGEMIFSTTANAIQLCRGTDWVNVNMPSPTAPNTGCTNPTGVRGEILFSQQRRVHQVCNGSQWADMACAAEATTGTGCTNPVGVTGTIVMATSNSITAMLACSGTRWQQMGVLCGPTPAVPTSCKNALDIGQNSGSGAYNIDPEQDGSTVTVYCDMNTDGGGWTLIAQNNQGSCPGSKNSTPPTNLNTGCQTWQVPTALANASTQILFHDRSGNKWARYGLNTAARNFLTTTNTADTLLNMTNQAHSGYRVCGYNTVEYAGGVYNFEFADLYPTQFTGYAITYGGSGRYYDNPLAGPWDIWYSCEYIGPGPHGYYYMPQHITFAVR